eukprot:13714452-Alexandrium_andersonii.AAC.1
MHARTQSSTCKDNRNAMLSTLKPQAHFAKRTARRAVHAATSRASKGQRLPEFRLVLWSPRVLALRTAASPRAQCYLRGNDSKEMLTITFSLLDDELS